MRFFFRLVFLSICIYSFPSSGQGILGIPLVDTLLVSKTDSLFVRSSPDTLGPESKSEMVPSLEDLIKKGKLFTLQSNQIKLELLKPLDTAGIQSELEGIELVISSLENRKLDSSFQFNFRYINTLNGILKKTEEHNQTLDNTIQSKLNRLSEIDSILRVFRKDDLFQLRIKDSLLVPRYAQEIVNLKRNLSKLDSTLFKQIVQAARIQSYLSFQLVRIQDLKQSLLQSQKQLESKLFSKEINFIWEDPKIPTPKSIIEITLDSFRINLIVLQREMRGQEISIVLSLLFILILYLWISKILKKVRNQETDGEFFLNRLRFLPRSPFASTMICVLPIVYFLFEGGTITFLSLILFLLICFSTLIIFRSYSPSIRLKWVGLVFILIFFILSNLYFEMVYQERMYLLIGSILVLVIYGRFGSFRFSSEIQTEIKFVNAFRLISASFLILGIVANLLGRYSLSKILSISGLVSFTSAVTLFLFVQITMEVIYLLLEGNKKQNPLDIILNFKELQNRMRSLISILALIGWAIILLHHLAFYSYFKEGLIKFLNTPRILGDSSFTFASIFLFIGILFLSSILANNTAFFFSQKDQSNSGSRTKKLGSSILIIRLGVLGVGFFIAATAAKIPLDKITLVLGALSVGIGFGLQTIINNLVSGLILAFERPIQIGDDIEVGTLTGKVKEVGIRASKILAYDGSEIIVPNGDLLSQSLINWTLSDKRRRIELLIGVAYQSEMERVQTLIQEVLNEARILKIPPPKILMQNFGESSVDFRVLFWVESMDIYLDVRNEVMHAIFETFLKNGIEIPYPKRDLYLKELPKSDQKPEKKEKSPGDDSGDSNTQT
ncbi:mechanosensitive ion channel family protein [Algoriphagus confluentis]|uniref:Mechanosensitive ion channel n=1 Tax=Algoriphagus confluentis TaxID=1697556 RepID=A0ABQ6PN51_9BACT|nr:hypothetical protein Aconfl_18360 [Algoriphagus confluentis]